ncbi:MAG: pantoate--beta-alanine ligase [Candidatus Omnitrophica bacterium]|nr:pantoate--beta-alanine ligase [Candidatus Omnitrophota bacterium]
MKIIRTIKAMKRFSRDAKKRGKTIGFVPTMGALHNGHLSLARQSKKDCDLTVVSVFVNPTQFGPREDLSKYPRNIRKDKKLLASVNVDVLFFPSVDEIYPGGYSTYVENTGNVAKAMCARFRPGHFKGVATVVTKLFNIVSPDISYFGQKDAQQAIIIKKMVKDLNFDTRIKIMPIVREKDGLAMSSRNVHLSRIDRNKSVGIYRALKKAKELIKKGTKDADLIKKEICRVMDNHGIFIVDYVKIVNAETLEPVKKLRGRTLIAIAAYVGKTRLIDNIVV